MTIDFSGVSAAQFSTRQVHNIAIDPFDDNYFVTAGPSNEPTVAVWDRRFAARSNIGTTDLTTAGSVLEFCPAINNRSPSTVWSLRYSGSRRGCFSILSSTGEIKVIELAQNIPRADSHEGLTGRESTLRTSDFYTKKSHNLRHPWQPEQGPENTTRIISTDFVGNKSTHKPRLLALRLNHDVEVLNLPEPPPHITFTPLDEVAIYSSRRLSMLQSGPNSQPTSEVLYQIQLNCIMGKECSKISTIGETDIDNDQFSKVELRNAFLTSSPDGMKTPLETSRKFHEALLNIKPTFTRSNHHAFLRLLDVQRQRCQEGYLFNCRKNKDIVANDPWLVDVWDLVERLDEKAKGSGMVFEALDLSYLGVLSIWTKIADTSNMQNRTSLDQTLSGSVTATVAVGICQKQAYPRFEGVETDFPYHRQICLAICGWMVLEKELEQQSLKLIENGEGYRAIVLSVFKGNRSLALKLLKYCIREKKLENIGLGAVIACERVSCEQQGLCAWMAEETNDPYLKALLAYFVSGDWMSVLDMEQLALGDRVGIALKHLNDESLGRYLDSATSTAISEGDVEGLVLTGLDAPAMDLLQSYVAKSNDLQTAVLVMSFTCPMYVSDLRWEIWKEIYFMQMQAWRCFLERTRFIVEHNKRAVTRDGRAMNEVPPGQVTLRCNHCLGSLARRDKLNNRSGTEEISAGSDPNLREPKAAAGVICPKCGRHMPRCGICMMWLGTPDPSKSNANSVLANLDVMAKLITFCMRCNHGFHSHHARDWYAKHRLCPVPECQCSCGAKH